MTASRGATAASNFDWQVSKSVVAVFKSVLDLLYPPRCAFCRDFLQKGQTLCPQCAESLPFCEGLDARQEGDVFSFCVSPLYYEGSVRESHHRYKFQGASAYARTYAPLVAQCIAAHCAGQYDLISWVPLSRKRLRKRGYDQAKLLAIAVAAELNTTAVATLKKVRNASAQSGLGGRDERRANIAGAYELLDSAAVSGKRILLIDDIITTGSSLAECAQCLLMADAKEVLCATLARSTV